MSLWPLASEPCSWLRALCRTVKCGRGDGEEFRGQNGTRGSGGVKEEVWVGLTQDLFPFDSWLGCKAKWGGGFKGGKGDDDYGNERALFLKDLTDHWLLSITFTRRHTGSLCPIKNTHTGAKPVLVIFIYSGLTALGDGFCASKSAPSKSLCWIEIQTHGKLQPDTQSWRSEVWFIWPQSSVASQQTEWGNVNTDTKWGNLPENK